MKEEKKKFKIIIPVAVAIVIIAIIGIIVMKGKNNSNYYENSALSNIKTFTQITGIQEKEIEEQATTIIYSYQYQDTNNYSNDYENYLLNDYGFKVNQDKSNDNKTTFEYDNKILITEKETKAGFTTYKITIPLNETIANENIEKKYNEAMELLNNKQYEEAKKIFALEGVREYKDAQQYIYYCNGIEYYDLKAYGLAIERFKQCENILNAKELENELLNIVSKYNGTWYYQHPSTNILGYYMCIKDGRIFIDAKSMYNQDSVYYNYSFMGKYNESTQQYDLYIGTSFVNEPQAKNYEFLFVELPDGRNSSK